MKSALWSAALVLALATLASAQQPSAFPNDGYNYKRHGIDWANGNQANCGGSVQSPINVETGSLSNPEGRQGVSAMDMNDFVRNRARISSDVVVDLNQGLKVSWTPPAGIDLPTLEIDGETHIFTPLQFHFHHFSSEHAVDGKLYPLELHMVMASNRNVAAGTPQLAVLGVLYEYTEEGEGDEMLKRLLSEVSRKKAQYGQSGVSIDLDIVVADDIIPAGGLDYAGYDGSLTTPPCDERVKWHLFLQPRKVSIEQMKVFADVTRAASPLGLLTSNREIMPLNGRTVYRYTAQDLPGAPSSALLSTFSPVALVASLLLFFAFLV